MRIATSKASEDMRPQASLVAHDDMGIDNEAQDIGNIVVNNEDNDIDKD